VKIDDRYNTGVIVAVFEICEQYHENREAKGTVLLGNTYILAFVSSSDFPLCALKYTFFQEVIPK
jgi:hypothetical protein